VAASIFLALGGLAQAQMKFAVQNLSGMDESKVWVLFFTGSVAVNGTYYSISQKQMVSLTPTTIGSTNAVRLSDVRVDPKTGYPTFYISAFNGQMWFSYGPSPVSFASGAPSPTSTASGLIANFNKRWQYIEPTVATANGHYSVNVDQTLIDFFSIPITVQANRAKNQRATTIPDNNQFSSTTGTMLQALAKSPISPSGLKNIYAVSKTGQNPPASPKSATAANVVRAVSPTQAPQLYHDWTAYLTALAPGGSLNKNGNLKIHLADSFVGSQAGSGNGFQAQYYDLQASVAAGSLAVTITGTTYTNSGKGTVLISGLTLTSTFAQLNATTGIYGNAAAFSWTSTTPMTSVGNGTASTSGNETASANDVLGRIMGDFLAGVSMGYPGSAFGATTPSGTWWNNPKKAFGEAQTNRNFYNTWAAALFPLTSSYGLGYEDRFGQNLLAFANGSMPGIHYVKGAFLQITLHPDGSFTIDVPERVIVKGTSKTLRATLSSPGRLRGHANAGARVRVVGSKKSYRVIVTNIHRPLTTLTLIAVGSKSEHARAAVKLVRK